MDLGHPMDRPYRPMRPDLAGPAQRIASFLGAGGRAVVITGPARVGKRALLDGLLAGMPGRITRVENRSGLPLALDGVLKQMGKVADTEGDERGLFFRTLAEQAYDDYSAVIAVEDAHTLTTLALTALARAPGLGGPDLPGMILLLTGEPALLEKLAGPGLEVLRNPRRTLLLALPVPGAAGAVSGPTTAAAMLSGPVAAPGAASGAATPGLAHAAPVLGVAGDEMSWARGNLGMRAIVIAIFAGAIAAAGGLTWSLFSHPVRRPAMAAVAAPIQAVSLPKRAASAEPGPSWTAASPISVPDAELHREFDAFLKNGGHDTATLTPAAREILFHEYRQWRVHAAAP